MNFLILACLLLTETSGFSVFLKTKEVLHVEEVAVDKNMLVFINTEGQVIAVSKALVDWERVYSSFPALFEVHCPEDTKAAFFKKVKDRNQWNRDSARKKKNIVLTTKDLKKMDPYKYQELFSDLKSSQKNNKNSKAKSSKSKPTAKKNSGKSIIQVIAQGNTVNLSDHLESGRYVIFDFYANWCGPCKRMAPALEGLVRSYPAHVALKKIDIQNWSTPVARQHGIRSIPYVVLYDPNGRKVSGVSARNVHSYLTGKASQENW